MSGVCIILQDSEIIGQAIENVESAMLSFKKTVLFLCILEMLLPGYHRTGAQIPLLVQEVVQFVQVAIVEDSETVHEPPKTEQPTQPRAPPQLPSTDTNFEKAQRMCEKAYSTILYTKFETVSSSIGGVWQGSESM
jgi:hypothetical protein